MVRTAGLIPIVAVLVVLGACTFGDEGQPAADVETTIDAPPPGGIDDGVDDGEPPMADDPSLGRPAVGCQPGDEPLELPPRTAVAFYAVCPQLGDSRPRPIVRADDDGRFGSGSLEDRIQRRLDALLAGTDQAERDVGLATGFDTIEADEGVTAAVAVDDGIATVTFTAGGQEWNPGPRAGSSAQLFSFLDPLLATVFHSPEVEGLDLDRLCWGELGCGAGVTTRSEWASTLFINAGALLTGHCDLPRVSLDPGRCTVAGMLDGPLVEADVVGVADDDTLNLRAGPGVDHVVVAEVGPTATVAATTARAVAGDGGLWRLVGAGSEAGWVNEAFLALERTTDERLVDAFVAFATDPDPVAFAELALADEVELGLGPDLVESVPAAELADPRRWIIDADEFRGYGGPFSILDALGRPGTEVAVGSHPHCAGDPMPPPDGFADSHRLSVAPHPDLIDSCLQWSTVDLFLDDDDRVAAITVDYWEP